jgi:polyphosphate kinase
MTDFAPEHFINRELSWLEFNQRVLDEARDPNQPLLERVKFFCIVSSNLDEFFEVRVAGTKQRIESVTDSPTVDGLKAAETFAAIRRRVRKLLADQYDCWKRELVPQLAKNGIRFLSLGRLRKTDREWLKKYYDAEVRPVLTPLAIDPAHPFPQLLNKSLNLMVELSMPEGARTRRHLAVVQVPQILPRLVKLPRRGKGGDYIFLGELIKSHLADLFPGTQILGHWFFRVTRNSELYIGEEEEMGSLLKAVEQELHNRRKGAAVRLEVERGCRPLVVKTLLKTLHLTPNDLYVIDGPLNPTRLMAIYQGDDRPELRDEPYVAPRAPALRGGGDIFAAIRERDILLHHPYESFESVIDFLETAASDPKVLAIKQTLYRTGGDTRIVGALMRAVNNGKQVTAVVELRARFDEANNIEWSRKLEEAGVHVVYGLVGLKIHCKMCLVVRHDDEGIRRYLHLSTGNYNATSSLLYTDIGLFTCQPDFGEDATNLFNLLTGICQFQGARKLLIAPFDLHDRMVALIRREAENARRGVPARVIAKMNSLVDNAIIKELYLASQAGVKIDLIIRGICCLRPGVKGVSDNITVRSIVDRYLEHSRIFYFENSCRPEVFMGSADWMPRNFFKRIEVVFPIESGVIRDRIVRELLALTTADNVKARFLGPRATYSLAERPAKAKKHRSQVEFMKLSKEPASGKKTVRKRPEKKAYRRVELAPKPTAD